MEKRSCKGRCGNRKNLASKQDSKDFGNVSFVLRNEVGGKERRRKEVIEGERSVVDNLKKFCKSDIYSRVDDGKRKNLSRRKKKNPTKLMAFIIISILKCKVLKITGVMYRI